MLQAQQYVHGCREEGEAGIHSPGQKSLINNFQYCFDGFGTFNMKPYHIVLDPKAKPVVHIPRVVPVQQKAKLRKIKLH